MEEELREILHAALAAAEPGRTVRRFLSMEDGRVWVGEVLVEPRCVFVLAVG